MTLLPMVADLEEDGSRKVYVVDELENSMHSLLTSRLLGGQTRGSPIVTKKQPREYSRPRNRRPLKDAVYFVCEGETEEKYIRSSNPKGSAPILPRLGNVQFPYLISFLRPLEAAGAYPVMSRPQNKQLPRVGRRAVKLVGISFKPTQSLHTQGLERHMPIMIRMRPSLERTCRQPKLL